MIRLSQLFRKTPKAIEKPAPTFTDIQQHMNVNQYLRDSLAEANVTISQMGFLLASAPMIDMFPHTWDGVAQMEKSQSPYAYINPKTLAPFVPNTITKDRFHVFMGSPTKWIPMSSMPEGRVIFSPLQVPGLEKSLVG